MSAPPGPLAEKRAALLAIINRPLVPAAEQVTDVGTAGGLLEQRFSFASDERTRIHGVLFRMAGASPRRPAVMVLHGTGGTKEKHVALLKTLATKGFVAVGIDARHHGSGGGYDAYAAAIVRAFQTGREHPFLYDTVWDVMRLLDYLGRRPDVDAARIGMTGFSKGGMETYLTAAVEPRIAAAAPLIGVQSFRWALENNAWQSRIGSIQSAVDEAARLDGVKTVDATFVRRFYDRVVPGIYGPLDGPAMLPAIAPRPLLVVNSDNDARTPLPGVELCARAASAAYKEAGADDRFQLRIQKGAGHNVTADSEAAMVAWMVRWLRP